MAIASLSVGLETRKFSAGTRRIRRDMDEIMGKAVVLRNELGLLQGAADQAFAASRQTRPPLSGRQGIGNGKARPAALTPVLFSQPNSEIRTALSTRPEQFVEVGGPALIKKGVDLGKKAVNKVASSTSESGAILDLADKTKISTDEIQKLRFAAEQFGVETADFDKALVTARGRLENFSADENSSGAEAFRALGISQELAQEFEKTSNGLLRVIESALGQFRKLNDSEQDAVSQGLFERPEGTAFRDRFLPAGLTSVKDLGEKGFVSSERGLKAGKETSEDISLGLAVLESLAKATIEDVLANIKTTVREIEMAGSLDVDDLRSQSDRLQARLEEFGVRPPELFEVRELASEIERLLRDEIGKRIEDARARQQQPGGELSNFSPGGVPGAMVPVPVRTETLETRLAALKEIQATLTSNLEAVTKIEQGMLAARKANLPEPTSNPTEAENFGKAPSDVEGTNELLEGQCVILEQLQRKAGLLSDQYKEIKVCLATIRSETDAVRGTLDQTAGEAEAQKGVPAKPEELRQPDAPAAGPADMLAGEGVKRVMQGVQDDAKSASRAIEDDFTDAFVLTQARAEEFGDVLDRVFDRSVDRLEGALTDFILTGKFDLKGLEDEILRTLTQASVKQLITDPLRQFLKSGVLPGIFGGIFSTSSGDGTGSAPAGGNGIVAPENGGFPSRDGCCPGPEIFDPLQLILEGLGIEFGRKGGEFDFLGQSLAQATGRADLLGQASQNAALLIRDELGRAASSASIALQLISSLTGGGGGGLGGDLISVLPSLFGLAGGPGTSPFGPQFSGTGVEGLLAAGSFATGGSITVPGFGAADSRLLFARVSPGEQIDFTPSGRQGRDGSGRGATVVVENKFIFQGGDPDSFNRALPQMAARAGAAMSRAVSRNG